jgi:tripartite ATP-independent transporter DctM subunit
MLKRGYDERLATGPVTAAAALAPIIPPSIALILYAVVTEQSVGDLFMAGFVPGFMLAGIMAIQIFIMVKRHRERAPAAPVPTWRERMVSLGKVWPAVLLIMIVLGTIYLGVCTATEAAALGAFGSLCIFMGMGRLGFRELLSPARRAMATSCMIFMIIIGAYIFGGLLAIDRIPHELASWVASLPVSRWFIMAGIQAMFFVLGFFLDVATLIVIVVPIIFPITQALGFDPVWLGIVLHINFAIAVITPPMALNLYVMSGIMKGVVSFENIVRGTMPFIISEAIALVVVMAFPSIALWLPNAMH